MEHLVTQEVRRTLRLRPRWRCYRDDLLQDGHEAALRAARHSESPAYIRRWIRGALWRAGMAYFGVSEKPGKAGRTVPAFVDVEEAWGLAAMPAPLEARLVLSSLAAKAQPRTQAILVALHGGATVRGAAAAVGVSHQTAYSDLLRLREAA